MSAERNQDPRRVPNSLSIEAEIKRRAIPSWETVKETIELRTHNNWVHHLLYERYTSELRDYYDTVYNKAAGKEGKEQNSTLPRAGLAYHFRIVRETVLGRTEKLSKGRKKGIRREKAASRK